MPPEIKDCVQSVLEDNPEYSESRAYAICNAMNNKGELENVKAAEDISAEEGPCWDGYTMVGTKTDENGNTVPRCVPSEDVPDADMAMAEESDCPDGKVNINGECIDVEEVHDVPPSALDMSAHRVLAKRTLAGPIERVELDNNTVRYKNVALIDRGVWTDAGSGEPTEYDPAELEVAENNAVNIMHDSESDASEAGYIEADSYSVEDETGYANVVLDLSKPAGEYADETLQETLAEDGEVGFGGPSIEIPAEGYDLEDTGNGHPKLVNGTINGMGFVRDPASKTTAFSHQVAQRGVAMSDGQSPKVYTKEDSGMTDIEMMSTEQMETLAERLGVDLDELEDAMSDMEMGDYEDEEDDEEDAEMEDGEMDDEEDDEDEMEMQDEALDVIQEQIDDIWGEIEEMKQQMTTGEEMSEAKSELASADTVQELKEKKEELDKRLSELESEPEEPKTLSDDMDEWEPQYESKPGNTPSW
jgi:hypothetical protein